MWGLLWNLWKNKKRSLVVRDMNFMFATDSISNWQNMAIYHNAGVVKASDDLFYKGAYTGKIPPKDLAISDKFASYNYYEILKKAL